jgi:hypothetical protein
MYIFCRNDIFIFLFLKGLFLINEFSMILKLGFKTLKIAIFIFILSNRNNKNFSLFFWKIGINLFLSAKINRENFNILEIFLIQAKFYKKKKYCNYWTFEPKKKNILTITKYFTGKIQKNILESIDFKIFMKKFFKCHFFFFNSLKYSKEIKFFEKYNLFQNYRKKRHEFFSFFFLSFLNLTIKNKCFFSGNIRFDINNYIQKLPPRWWRIFKIRETELEYLEKNLIFFYSFTFF